MSDLTHTVTAFHESAEWTGIMDGQREAWLEARNSMLTASDVACVLGLGRRSALSVWVDKIMPRKEPEKVGLDDPRFWGKELEQTILSAVARENEWDYRRGGALLRSRKYPFLGATLDAEVNRHDGRGWVDLEGKTSRVTKEWNENEQDCPTPVLIQVQAQTLVTKAPLGIIFALLVGSRPCQIEIEPDQELHAIMIEEGERFMEQVRTLTQPDVDGSDSSKEALTRLYPFDNGEVVRLPEEAMDWTRELSELNKQIRDLEKRKSELQNRLRQSIGGATIGVLSDAVDGKQFWRWQLQTRKEHVVKESSSRVLLAMKNGPPIEDPLMLPEASPLTTLEQQLRDSLAANESNVTPIKRTRRRSKR